MIAANHTTLINIARARLHDAEIALRAGDDARHNAAATASAAIATAAATVIIADRLMTIERHLARIADNSDTLAARDTGAGEPDDMDGPSLDSPGAHAFFVGGNLPY
jgi:hypothetical protein